MIERLIEKLAMNVAWLLPKRLVMWCFIRIWAHATTGEFGSEEAPALLCADALKRWDKK